MSDGIQFCGFVADSEAIGGNAKWPHNRFSWFVAEEHPTMPINSLRKVIAESFRRWSNVCGIDAFEATSASGSNLIVRMQDEGPGRVLADCQLPFDGITPNHSLFMRWDRKDRFVLADNAPANMLDAYRVGTHELGHFLGMGHGPQGCLMAPMYSAKISHPVGWDIVEAVARYGNPLPKTNPQEPPKSTPEEDVEFLRILNAGRRIIIARPGIEVIFPDGRKITS